MGVKIFPCESVNVPVPKLAEGGAPMSTASTAFPIAVLLLNVTDAPSTMPPLVLFFCTTAGVVATVYFNKKRRPAHVFELLIVALAVTGLALLNRLVNTAPM